MLSSTVLIVSPQEWEAARLQLLVKEKGLTRARDAPAAERRRMPWLAVEKEYEFDGPEVKASLLDLFDGRHQLIVYRAFFEPGVSGWPEHACIGCSMLADQVAHVAHLNARDTTLAFVSRAPQTDIERVKARMGWEMPWYTLTDGFDTDFGVDEWHGTNAFIRDGDSVFRTYFINNRGDEALGSTWSYLDMTALGRQEEWEACAEGDRTHTEIAAALGCNPVTVTKWRHRFAADRLDGLVDAPRPGAARTIGDDVIEAIVVETLETAPPDATHWSTRGLAAKHGISHTTVREIWRAFGLKPWQEDEFKMSPDPDLVEKIRDIVALYMNPPVAAAVFAVDEKPQIQALNRTAPTLPMLPTTPARATHDDQRNGTCDLFAALEIATGRVITEIRPRHTSADFVAFLNKVNRNVPAELDVHVILDNLSAHKTPTVQRWLLRHRRFHLHFTPTYGSWMNLVERWFPALTTNKLQRAAHRNVKELAADIEAWAANWNENPPPSCGTRAPNRSSNASPATAPPSTRTPPHDANTFSALQASRTLGGELASLPADVVSGFLSGSDLAEPPVLVGLGQSELGVGLDLIEQRLLGGVEAEVGAANARVLVDAGVP